LSEVLHVGIYGGFLFFVRVFFGCVFAVFMFGLFSSFVVGSILSVFLRGCCLHKFGVLSFFLFFGFGAGLWGL